MAYNKNTYIVEGFTVFGINVCVCVCVVVICFFSLSTHHVWEFTSSKLNWNLLISV